MTQLVYDGSFGGLLTALFEAVEYRFDAPKIIENHHYQEELFSKVHQVITQENKAQRILTFFEKKLSKSGMSKLIKLYLYENSRKNQLFLELLNKCIHTESKAIFNDIVDNTILEILQIEKKVIRESHRMKAFARFQQMENGYYFAEIEPDFDVLPLIKHFFVKRYADQPWMILDVKRQYAMNYDTKEVIFLYLTPEQLSVMAELKNQLHTSEKAYQRLWKSYFEKTNIQERKNTKLHLQHLPKRYWKYLTEKN